MPDLLIKNDNTLDDFLLNASRIFQQLNNQVMISVQRNKISSMKDKIICTQNLRAKIL